MSDTFYIYIMANKTNSVVYVGVTNNLERRVTEHKNGVREGFTKKYRVHKLVYFEEYTSVNDAIHREKEIKAWRREKKNALIATLNPEWRDLAEE